MTVVQAKIMVQVQNVEVNLSKSRFNQFFVGLVVFIYGLLFSHAKIVEVAQAIAH